MSDLPPILCTMVADLHSANRMLRLLGSFRSPLSRTFSLHSSFVSPCSLRPPWSQAASSEVSLAQPLATDSRGPKTTATRWWSQETPCFVGKSAILHARKKESAHRPKKPTQCSEKQSSVRPGGFNRICELRNPEVNPVRVSGHRNVLSGRVYSLIRLPPWTVFRRTTAL